MGRGMKFLKPLFYEGFWIPSQKSLMAIRRDKSILLFSLFPILIGFLFYIFLWMNLWGIIPKPDYAWLEKFSFVGDWIYYLFIIILNIAFWFFFNWTFTLTISLISSPFNDVISNRVERAIGGKRPASLNESFLRMLNRLKKTLVNEVKKITLIFFLSLTALILGWIPLLLPFSLILSSFLMAVSFLDFSWCRHDMNLKSCFKDIKKSFWLYGLSGGLFMIMMSIPLFNLFILPLGTLYYTILFSRQRVH